MAVGDHFKESAFQGKGFLNAKNEAPAQGFKRFEPAQEIVGGELLGKGLDGRVLRGETMLGPQRFAKRINHDLQDAVTLAQGACFDEGLDLRGSLVEPGRVFARSPITRGLLAQDGFVLGGNLFAQRGKDALKSPRKAESLRDAGLCLIQKTFASASRIADSSGVGKRPSASRSGVSTQRERTVSNIAFGPCAQEEDERSRRRFFQGLQKGMGSLRLHAVGVMDDGDFASADKRLSLDRVLEVTDLFNDDAS